MQWSSGSFGMDSGRKKVVEKGITILNSEKRWEDGREEDGRYASVYGNKLK